MNIARKITIRESQIIHAPRPETGQLARVNRVNIRTDQNENRCKPLLSRNRPQNGGLLFFLYTAPR
jgi:hypothetical protein